MLKNGMYFAKRSIYELIRSLGGEWNDSKERPIVCIFESKISVFKALRLSL